MIAEEDRILYGVFILGCGKLKNANFKQTIDVINREFEMLKIPELTLEEIKKIDHVDEICWIVGKTRGYNREAWRR